jgi:hypothetical protein
MKVFKDLYSIQSTICQKQDFEIGYEEANPLESTLEVTAT